MKPEPVLTHMPLPVQLKIAGFVDTVTKFSSLRCCSKHFKDIVDTSKTHYPSIKLTVFGESIYVTLVADNTHQQEVCFYCHDNLFSYKKRSTMGKTSVEELKEGDCYLAAVEHFAEIMRNPRISVGSFEAYFSTTTLMLTFTRHWETVFDSIQRKICVERFIITSPLVETICAMMSVLKPGFLKTIVWNEHSHVPLSLDEVVELEQWKRAVELDASDRLTEEDFPCSHFETLSLKVTRLTLQAVESTVQNFYINSNKKSTTIQCSTADNEVILAYLVQFEKIGNGYFIPIPGSGGSLEVCFSREPSFMFTVKRINRN